MQTVPLRFTHTKTQTDTAAYTPASVSLYEGAGTLGEKHRPFDHGAGVRSFGSWVYAAAMLNAQAVASLPLRLYVKGSREKSGFYVRGRKCLFATRPVPRHRKRWLTDSDTGPDRTTRRKLLEFDDYEEVTESHPLLELLSNVNPHWNGFDMTALRILYGELTGNAYHLMVHGDGKQAPPTELWPMPSQWTWIVPGRDGEKWIDGYVYGQQFQDRVMFEPDEVLHFRRPNPNDLHYGMGKVEASWATVKLNEANHTMDTALADNHARPDYAVIMEGATPDQATRMQSDIDRRFRGRAKSGRSLVMGGPKITLTPLSFPPKDMVGRDDVVEEIAAVFGVPVTMLKANDPNLASAKTGYAMWRETTILPLCRMDEQTLNQSLVPFFDADLCLAYDNPVPSDRTQDEAEAMAQVNSGRITLNEWRATNGYEPIEGGDKPMVNGQPLGGSPMFNFGAFGGTADQGTTTTTEEAEPVEAVPATPVADEPVADVPEEQDLQTTQDTVLNGAQIGSATTIVIAVVAGELPRDSGIGMLQTFFNLDIEVAERIMGSAGKPEVATTPNPKPKEEQPVEDQPAPAPAPTKTISLKDIMQGCDSLACDCHPSTPTIAKSWDIYRTKASADNNIREAPENPLEAFSEKMGAIFAKQRGDVVKVLKRAKLGTKIAKDPDSLVAELIDALNKYNAEIDGAIRPFITTMAQVGGNVGIEQLNTLRPDAVAGVFDVANPRVSEFLETYSVELRQQVQGYTGQAIAQTVKTQLADGKSTADIATALRDDASFAGGSLSPARSEAIARTESARAYVEGERKAWDESGVVQGKKWLLAPDACEFCQEVARQFNDKAVALNDPFFAKGSTLTVGGSTMKLDYTDVQGPPLHPNDRCDLVPVLQDFTT